VAPDLAKPRTERVLKDVRLIQNLGDRNHYRYTAGEVEKIFSSIRKAVDQAEMRFSEGGGTSFEL
jgi:hypothetical protein